MELFISLIVIIFGYVIKTYNSFIKKKNKIKQAASAIDVYLTQRFDLIPNLVECVKGYMIHENDTFMKIAEKRTQYMQTRNLKEGEVLNAECNRIVALAENNPELKASEHYLHLQKNLAKMESQLQAARRIYNAEVNIYNNKVQMFPSNFIAGAFNFVEEEFFEAEDEKRDSININY